MAERDSSDTSGVDEPWIPWMCSLKMNKILCEVDKAFIEDSFNLYGLKMYFPTTYNKALNVLLDREDDTPYSDEITHAAVELYGLIHARYIVTIAGLEVMRQKYKRKDFGECPRWFCKGQAVVPVGASDEPNQMRLKMFCPRCRDVYSCSKEGWSDFDGAVFGTTFAHIFFMTYEDLVPPAANRANEVYVPRVFGFKIHSSSGSLPRPAITVSSQSSGSSPAVHHPAVIHNDYDDEDAQLFTTSHPKRKLASFNNNDRHIVGMNSTGESISSSAGGGGGAAMAPSVTLNSQLGVTAAKAGTASSTLHHPVPSLPTSHTHPTSVHRTVTSPPTTSAATVGMSTRSTPAMGSGKKSRIE